MATRTRGLFEKDKGSGVWWICYFDADGRKRREKAGTKAVALKLYTKRKQESLERRKLPESLRARRVTFGELLDAASEHTERNTPVGGEKRYKCRMELLKNAFGSLPADAITPLALSRWLSEAQREHHWRPATANRYKAFISLAFRLGLENSRCQSNPARLVKRLRENNERTRFLSPDEEKRLRGIIERDHPSHIPEFNIALNTGIRRGEQYHLQWADVDLQARRITLRQTKNGTTRYVPLNSAALAAFQALWERSSSEGRVFQGEKGLPLERPRYWWDAAVVAANLQDFHWHDLRHTFASRCVMAGVDLRTLAQLLGHKTLQMVFRYSHLSQSHELAAVERLCEAVTLTAEKRGDTTNDTSSEVKRTAIQ
jgi:integrase